MWLNPSDRILSHHQLTPRQFIVSHSQTHVVLFWGIKLHVAFPSWQTTCVCVCVCVCMCRVCVCRSPRSLARGGPLFPPSPRMQSEKPRVYLPKRYSLMPWLCCSNRMSAWKQFNEIVNRLLRNHSVIKIKRKLARCEDSNLLPPFYDNHMALKQQPLEYMKSHEDLRHYWIYLSACTI